MEGRWGILYIYIYTCLNRGNGWGPIDGVPTDIAPHLEILIETMWVHCAHLVDPVPLFALPGLCVPATVLVDGNYCE
jgi:hypothetical protein